MFSCLIVPVVQLVTSITGISWCTWLEVHHWCPWYHSWLWRGLKSVLQCMVRHWVPTWQMNEVLAVPHIWAWAAQAIVECCKCPRESTELVTLQGTSLMIQFGPAWLCSTMFRCIVVGLWSVVSSLVQETAIIDFFVSGHWVFGLFLCFLFSPIFTLKITPKWRNDEIAKSTARFPPKCFR